MKKLKIATVFSGIGALEESLKQLGIPHVIQFACDNGEREPKQSLTALLKVANEVLSEDKVRSLLVGLIHAIFARKVKNKLFQEDILFEYDRIIKHAFSDLNSLSLTEIRQIAKDIDGLYDLNYFGVKFSFKLKLNDLADVAKKVLEETEIRKFVDAWYKTTKTENFVKTSYLKNYDLKEDSWFEDVRFLDGTKYKGKVDLFMGGSPCQSFSTYGKKKGLEDARGTLFYDYARLIKEIRPKVFIYENVRGLTTHDKKRTWKVMQEIFHSLDYTIHAKILNAQDYGLPQKRERIFVVGIRNDIPRRTKFEFPEHVEIEKYAPEYLDKEVDKKYYLGKKGFEWVTNPLKNKNKTRYNRQIIGCQTANQQDNWIGDLIVETPREELLDEDRIYKGILNGEIKVARKMTPQECLRLMGFKHFEIASSLSDKTVYRQAGNSIAVPVVNALVKQLNAFLKYKEEN